MAEKQDNGPPPLEDPNSVDYECVICHNKVNSQCLSCLEKALQMTSFDRIYKYIPQPDSDGNDYVCEICDNKVKNLCHACMETAKLRSNYIRNAHDVDVISDSSRSSDTNLDFVQNFDESGFLVKHLTMKLEQCKSLTFEKRVERDSDTESDDMPPLEETKKTNFDSDEDSDELPPLVPRN